MTPVETIAGMGERGIVEGVNSSMIYLMYCKNFCKSHNVPLTSTTIKKKEEERRIQDGD
jgi:galactitol-specific phosphotransferase system IIB component